MKTVVICSTLLLAFAVLATAKPHHPLPPHKVAAKEACLKKLDLTEEKLHDRDENTDKKNRHCFFACMDKELGILKADGTIDREEALKDFPPSVPQENRTSIVDACYQQKGADDCETSDLYHTCVRKLKPRRPLSPELEKIRDSCKEKLSLTDEDFHVMRHSGAHDTRNCFMACLIKGTGFMNEDGTFNKEIFIEKSPADKKEAAPKVAEECAKEVTADECETAVLLHKCVEKNGFNDGDFYPSPPSTTQKE